MMYVDDVVLVVDGARPHRLQIHVKQESKSRLDEAADVRDGQMLVLHPEAHMAPRQLLLLETVLETGPGTRLQCSQHGRVIQMASGIHRRYQNERWSANYRRGPWAPQHWYPRG
jgi:hypothetical protein